jgi:hypothetical protein
MFVKVRRGLYVRRLNLCWGRTGGGLRNSVVEFQVAEIGLKTEFVQPYSKIVRGSSNWLSPEGELSAHLTQQSHSDVGNNFTLGNESSNRVTTARISLACKFLACSGGKPCPGRKSGARKNCRLPRHSNVSLLYSNMRVTARPGE